ncbi:autotransporter outer membrane beta-barrel domain-containing protein [Bartonella florencae]|uniref:autotransporter outer membrane beta-barrel domain-containing protein n=1 Tax=Bartonella florencae TaxID=928210 RepID=UPI00054D51A3|nr:autotransporter outer membrane beta-barrel domain-containing protein [Bartonella florencae]
MKKSFLLCTVSGVLFCTSSSFSYAHSEIFTPHTTRDFPSSQPTSEHSKAKREQSVSITPRLPRDTTAKSRRRPTPSFPSSPPSTEEMLSISSVSTQPVLKESRSELPATPTRLVTGIPPAAAQPNALRPVAEMQPVPIKLEPKQPIPVQLEKPEQDENIKSGIEVEDGKTVTLQNVKIQDKGSAVHAHGKNSLIKIEEGTVAAGFVALSASNEGAIDATAVTVTAETAGLVNINGKISLKDSTINVTGAYEEIGIIFRNDPYHPPESPHARSAEKKADVMQEQGRTNTVVLENTKLFVENGVGIGIYGLDKDAEVNLKDSEIRADVLLKNTKRQQTHAQNFTLAANNSYLEGRVRTLGENKTTFDLTNGAKWLLKANKNAANNDKDSSDYTQFSVDEKSYSNLSKLALTDSVVVFDEPKAGQYQTLLIGPNPQQGDKEPNMAAVYSAKGTAAVHLNSRWSSHSPVKEQETDRLVIHGDVSGTTTVHINLLEKDKKLTDSGSVWGEQMALLPSETHGISVIQVSGKANENSFLLAGNYMTMNGLPYKYVLTAYAPGTSHENQNLFGKNNRDFWDFRLQNAYLNKDKKIRALVPQVANYLVTPGALFSAGFTDVNNQNILLDNIYTTIFDADNNKKSPFFLSSYGEKVTLSSNRDPLHYGYGADVNYGALQLGVVLAALEEKDINTYFGLLGSYGKLSFTPKDMQDSEKTTLDKWSITSYSGIQHSNGMYLNTLLSYGALKGNITTSLVGNVAKLDDSKTLNISATIGQKLATGMERLIFEPQAQFIYQKLTFDIISDANNFEVDMGNPHQWLVRIGGRLTQTLNTMEEGSAFAFYGKLNVIRAFADGKTIKIADTFHLDPTGSSIEGGIGVNAFLSGNIALHGDISYRQKLQKAGVSGTNVSGGIRYHF